VRPEGWGSHVVQCAFLGQEGRRTGGQEGRRAGGQEDRRAGGQEGKIKLAGTAMLSQTVGSFFRVINSHICEA
jgi:hypothetical protein